MEKINTKYGIAIVVVLFLVITTSFLYYLNSSKVEFNNDSIDILEELPFKEEISSKGEFYLEEFDKDIREVSFSELSNSLYQPK
ncbi:MAG: hypothetical protein LBC61_04305 [Candidatus Peribacteria bacterium]|jgi:uncharacterized protein YpmB|nr:hypothetical protein [Candidatus Peribacteria bacterium]